MTSLRAHSLAEIVTFTRASVANYIDSSGVLSASAVDEPRIEYDPVTLACRGLLIEPARTNYLLRSQEFDNASWAKTRATVTANAAVAPDGTTTMDKLVEDGTASNSHYALQQYTKSSTSEVQAYSLSVYAKAGERTRIRLYAQGNSGVANSAGATFDLSSGTITSAAGGAGAYDTAAASISPCGNGVYRCSLEFRVNNDGQTQVQVVVYLTDASGSTTYSGDGTSGVYLWGAQLEKGSYTTSYIGTAAATATRAVDVARLDSLGQWFSDTVGTLYVEYMVPWTYNADGGSRRAVQIDDGTENNRLIVYVSGAARYVLMTTGGVAQATITRGNVAAGVIQKQAVSWVRDDVSATASGSTVSSDSSAEIPQGLTTLRLGNSTGSSELVGYIRKVRYWPRTMSDSELQALVA